MVSKTGATNIISVLIYPKPLQHVHGCLKIAQKGFCVFLIEIYERYALRALMFLIKILIEGDHNLFETGV